MPASRLYPSDGPRVNDSRGEALVWNALHKHLPQGWVAYHSLRLRSRQGVEGEGDFVIAVPDRGPLLLEVKGGRIEVRDGRWLQNGYEMKRPPRAQAHSFGKLLLRVLGERDIWLPSWGIATCFPETEFDTPPAQGDLQGTVLGANDLAWLRDALPVLVDRAFGKPDSRAKGDWLAAIHELWCETWTPSLSLGTRAKVDDANRRSLDETQLAILESWEDTPRLLVEGEAGSGKTLVAREFVREELRRGKRVLYVCFTDALAAGMRSELPEAADVFTVSGFLLRLFELAGKDPGDRAAKDFWDALPARALKDAFGAAERAWDTLVVDEAQDLTDDMWIVLREIALGKKLWAFRSTQQAFWTDRNVPDDLFPVRHRLKRAYRCPPELLAVASAYRGEGDLEAAINNATAAKRLFISEKTDAETHADRITRVLTRLINEGFAPGDIAVISLRGQTPEGAVSRLDHIGAHRVVRANASDTQDNIVADTFLRFKGLERKAIVLADTDLVEDNLGIRMYVAITRATSVVVMEAGIRG